MESEMISASAGRNSSCWTKSSTIGRISIAHYENKLASYLTIDVAVQPLAKGELGPLGELLNGPVRV
jgi:hypothetical protein